MIANRAIAILFAAAALWSLAVAALSGDGKFLLPAIPLAIGAAILRYWK